MKITLFTLLFLFLNLSASTINMKYIGELSLFGKVGDATMSYSNDGKNYHIKVKGGGSGIVASLTKNKRYLYESIGKVENGVLIPSKYIGTELSNSMKKVKTYTFDYKNSKTLVSTYKREMKEISTFNIHSFKYDVTNKLVESTKVETLENIYKDDMVSVFFNKRNKLLDMQKNDTKTIHAVGSKDTQSGMLVRLKKVEGGKYTYSINIKKDYLDGGSEDATFVLDANNILYETKLAGILFFGDARVRRLH